MFWTQWTTRDDIRAEYKKGKCLCHTHKEEVSMHVTPSHTRWWWWWLVLWGQSATEDYITQDQGFMCQCVLNSLVHHCMVVKVQGFPSLPIDCKMQNLLTFIYICKINHSVYFYYWNVQKQTIFVVVVVIVGEFFCLFTCFLCSLTTFCFLSILLTAP